MTVQEIKSRYRLSDEIRRRGIEINRQGFCRCPLHSGDDTASMKIYEDQDTFHCFGCGQGGDIIAFVRLMDNLSFRDACREICGEDLTGATSKYIAGRKSIREAEKAREESKRKRLLKLEEEICQRWQMVKYYWDTDPFCDEAVDNYNKWQLLTYKACYLTGMEMIDT